MITSFGSKRVNLRSGGKVYLSYVLILKQSRILRRQPYKTASHAREYSEMVSRRYERMFHATR